MAVKSRETGWIGSKYVGVEEAMRGQKPKPAAPAPAAPAAPVGSQGKKPGEWRGSTYIGPGAALAPAAKPAAPAKPIGSQGKLPGQWQGSKYIGPATPAAPPSNAPAPVPMGAGSPALPAGARTAAPPIDPTLPPEEQEAIRLADQNRQYEQDNPQYVDALQNYWAPDREQQLQRLRDEADARAASSEQGAAAAAGGSEIPSKRTGAAPPGFEQKKWADPSLGTSNKYIAGGIIEAGGSVDDVLRHPSFQGWTKVSNDKIKSPTGAVYDLVYDIGGPNQRTQYTRIGGTGTPEQIAAGRAAAAARNAAAGAGGAGAGAGGAGTGGSIGAIWDNWFGAGGGGGAGAGSSTPAGSGTTQSTVDVGDLTSGFGGRDDAINQAIMRLLARGETPLDPNDPRLMAQFLPTRNVMERGAREARAAAAERMAQEGTLFGGGGGAYSGEVNRINEDLAGRQGQLMSQLVTSELEARRKEVTDALQLAQGSQRMALQAQLSAIDTELERERLKQQNNQFYDEFGLRMAQSEYDRSRPPGV